MSIKSEDSEIHSQVNCCIGEIFLENAMFYVLKYTLCVLLYGYKIRSYNYCCLGLLQKESTYVVHFFLLFEIKEHWLKEFYSSEK